MSTKILRWKAGFAGDMILSLMHRSGIPLANATFTGELERTGRTKLDFSHVDSKPLTELDNIAMRAEHVDLDVLEQEINSLPPSWVKSHCYTDRFDSITVDLVADPLSLPFVLKSAVAKTDIVDMPFNPLTTKITDSDVRQKFSMYSIGRDIIDTRLGSTARIPVSSIIASWEHLCHCLSEVGIELLPSAEPLYARWVESNQQYFPSAEYIELINTKNFDYQANLTLAERYSLLLLSGSKFKILPDNQH